MSVSLSYCLRIMQNVRKFSVVDDALRKRLVNCAKASPTSTAFAGIHIYPFDAIDNHGCTVAVSVAVGALAVSVASTAACTVAAMSGVNVGVTVGVAVSVGVAVAVSVAVAVGVSVGVKVGVGAVSVRIA